MTALDDRARPADVVVSAPAAPVTNRWRTPGCLALIMLNFGFVSYMADHNPNPFQDEGLYLFMGHRMLDHVLSGVHVTEYPGTYFSGAPGLYPVLASLVESVTGVEGARGLSFLFGCLVLLGAFGIGKELFGTAAGLFGAAAISVCGSVIFIANLATFDAMALALVAGAAWLAIYSANNNRVQWAPVIGLLLAVAFLTKYAVAVYAPGICALAVLTAWPSLRWGAIRRAYVIIAAASGAVLLILTYFAYDLRKGILSTTVSRRPLSPAPAEDLAENVALWVGPWLLLALIGMCLTARKWPVALVLVGLSVIGPVQQIRIGEGTSLSKHVAFGLVFAAPLIGVLAVWLTDRRWRFLGAPLIAIVAVTMLVWGVMTAGRFQTSWVDDSQMIAQLREELVVSPDKPILGEEPSAQRFALRDATQPRQWNDTFVLLYGGKKGMDAYKQAIDQTHFGVIYLTLNTANGKLINRYLAENRTPYRVSAKVPFYRRGVVAGEYLVWTPKVLAR